MKKITSNVNIEKTKENLYCKVCSGDFSKRNTTRKVIILASPEKDLSIHTVMSGNGEGLIRLPIGRTLYEEKALVTCKRNLVDTNIKEKSKDGHYSTLIRRVNKNT